MSIPFSEINDTVVDAFNKTVDAFSKVPENITAVATEAVNGAFVCLEHVTLFFSTNVLPHVQPLIEKIQTIDFAAIASAVKEFFLSDVGIASSLLGGSIFCVVTARKVQNDFAAVALIGAAIGASVFSSFMFFKPELIRAAVGV